MSNPSLKLVTVDLQRATRFKLLAPADVGNDTVQQVVQYFYDGSTMYGGGETENGDVIVRHEDPTQNDAQVAESEPAEHMDSSTARAIAEYWNWAIAQMETDA